MPMIASGAVTLSLEKFQELVHAGSVYQPPKVYPVLCGDPGSIILPPDAIFMEKLVGFISIPLIVSPPFGCKRTVRV